MAITESNGGLRSEAEAWQISSVLLRIWKINPVHEDLQILPSFFQGDANSALIFPAALIFQLHYSIFFKLKCIFFFFLKKRNEEIKVAVFVRDLKCWIFNLLVNFALRVVKFQHGDVSHQYFIGISEDMWHNAIEARHESKFYHQPFKAPQTWFAVFSLDRQSNYSLLPLCPEKLVSDLRHWVSF